MHTSLTSRLGRCSRTSALLALSSFSLFGAVQGTVPASAHASFAGTEAQIRRCVNGERHKRGLGPLKDNKVLDRAARYHARNMERRNFFDHTDPWGRGPGQRVGLFDHAHQLFFIGENIAAGASTARAACRLWMSSAGHRANILDRDYTVMGAGFARGRRGYQTYFVQDFGQIKPSPKPPAPAPQPPQGPVVVSHHVTVSLFNADDTETLYLNGQEVAQVSYGESQTVDLGFLTDSDSLAVVVDNAGGGYTWGIRETTDGQTVLDDEAGTAGQTGAQNNDQSLGHVHVIGFDDQGNLSANYTAGQ